MRKIIHKVIFFGPLFTQAERTWNRLLKQAIEKESDGGFHIVLSQDEAAVFVTDKIDIDGIVAGCLNNAKSYDLAIAILDGPDVDSGTCVEIGFRKGNNRALPILGIRTDLRSSEDGGTNAMLRICDKKIYFPSFNESVTGLAQKIVKELKLMAKDIRK
ncbi:MAG: hypothetical protein UT37_C0008G0027 [Parcubacteria group bacterium GW2011_GWA2_39_18]|nr:MAG: hypothetical protein UT37_C0008G0027 [Parcubacteria group bacterium GW2011_GWA2_39_18]